MISNYKSLFVKNIKMVLHSVQTYGSKLWWWWRVNNVYVQLYYTGDIKFFWYFRELNLFLAFFTTQKTWPKRSSSTSLFLCFHDFLLERVWLREMDGDLVGGQLVVDLSHSVDLAFNLLLIKWVEEDSDVLLAIKGNSGWFSSDCSWVALLLNIN